MDRATFWQNFNLGLELNIAGRFVYNGLECLHNMATLDVTEEIFEVLYNLSVGLERIQKVAIILLEYDGSHDEGQFEQSLITHNHLELLRRIRAQG